MQFSTSNQAFELQLINLEIKDRFLEAVSKSQLQLEPFVYPPATKSAFERYYNNSQASQHLAYVIMKGQSGDIAGIINLNEIVYGSLCSAYLGFYLFHGFQGKGIMHQGLKCVIAHAFSQLKLHRLEANIQPNNSRSVKLIKSLNFKLEGFSPQYLKINKEWRDHERYAILNDHFIDFE